MQQCEDDMHWEAVHLEIPGEGGREVFLEVEFIAGRVCGNLEKRGASGAHLGEKVPQKKCYERRWVVLQDNGGEKKRAFGQGANV